jgi:hypothetical protein
MIAVVLLCAGTTTQADLVIDWNNIWMDAVKDTGGGPGPIARAGAMFHGSIYDAVNSISDGHKPYLGDFTSDTAASKEAAVTTAAERMLSHLYPTLSPTFTAARDAKLALIADGSSKTAGISVGQAAADAMIAARAGDGADADAMASYTNGTGPGHWQLTEPIPAWGPIWYQVTPFVISSHDQFRPAAPPALDSAAYAAAFNDVKEKGALVGSTRTAEETAIAAFWANDVDGSYKPPGHLNRITQIASQQQGLSMEQNARLFAMLNLALADASIVAWDAKYATDLDFWRPVTGIRNADEDDPTTLMIDEDNPATITDATWTPFTDVVNGFTPPFPAYTSGHATFGAAHAAVMRNFFGTDNMLLSIDTDDPYYNTILGLGDRTFSSFTQMALENGRSRIYLGVHWQFDADFAFTSGTQLGDYVFANILGVPEPSMCALLTLAGLTLIRRR